MKIVDEAHKNNLEQKKTVLRKGLENIPKSEKLWKNYKDHPKATNIQKPVDMTDIHIPKKYESEKQKNKI